jgi:CHC2 zinc finger
MLETYRALFVQRTDAYSRQRRRERRYYHVGKPLTDEVLRSHLKGELTIGLYSVDRTGHTKWSVIDCDDEDVTPLQEIGQELTSRGIPSYLELSRAGGHRWIFWGRPIRPDQAKKILSPVSRGYELFPAGDIPDEEGYGLALRGPLGVHQLTGRRYPFVDENLAPVSPGVARGQLAWLKENVVYADPGKLEPLQDPPVVRERAPKPYNGVEASPIRAFNETHNIRDVVGQYTRLNRSGVGRCPWGCNHKHNDRSPSFQVYERSNRWYCYTEHRGGDIASFLMAIEEIDAREFVKRYC